MNYLDTFEKRLHDETATVENEIESYKQRLEALNNRLEGLKRAAELFESEQGAISELLQAGSADGSVIARQMTVLPAAKAERATTSPKPTAGQGRPAPVGRSKTPTGTTRRSASQNG